MSNGSIGFTHATLTVIQPVPYKRTRRTVMVLHNNPNNKQEITMNITQQQAAAQALLALVKVNLSTNAIVAGGAPRDWSLGRKASDIDIFVQVGDLDVDVELPAVDIELSEGEYAYSSSKGRTTSISLPYSGDIDGSIRELIDEGAEQVIIHRNNTKLIKLEPIYPVEEGQNPYNTNEKLKVYNAITPLFPELKFQIILLRRDPREYVDTFTANISRCYMDDEGNPVRTDDAQTAIDEQVISFNSDTTEYYIDKISNKFPEYEIVRPEVLTGGSKY